MPMPETPLPLTTSEIEEYKRLEALNGALESAPDEPKDLPPAFLMAVEAARAEAITLTDEQILAHRERFGKMTERIMSCYPGHLEDFFLEQFR